MNYFEFRQQLLTDSFTKDEEFHRLRKKDLRYAKAYEQAMEFEKTIKRAFDIKAPENLKDSIILRQATTHTLERSIRRYAIAATLFLSLLIVSTTWYIKQPGYVEKFVINAVKMEHNVALSEQPIPTDKVEKIFASFHAKVGEDLGQVRFIKICPTPEGNGVHLVVDTDTGPVTILYMPKTQLNKERIEFDFDRSKGTLVAMESGAVALIADSRQQLAFVESKVHKNIFPL